VGRLTNVVSGYKLTALNPKLEGLLLLAEALNGPNLRHLTVSTGNRVVPHKACEFPNMTELTKMTLSRIRALRKSYPKHRLLAVS
jgi:hypothetical protein